MVEMLISFEGDRWLRACDGNSTAIAWCNRTEALRVDFGETTRARRRQPKAQQVSLTLGLGIIFERRAIVQDRVVVHELDIAGFEFHHQVELRIVCQFIEKIAS